MTEKRVLELFKMISAIPRGSGNARGISDAVRDFALRNGCEAEQDKACNVFVIKRAAPGYEHVTTLVFQAHMDMVCVADAGVCHDFLTDSICVEEEDGWLFARGTSLGADDGLGVAVMLALIEDPAPSGRLEFIFTTEEETSMAGAAAFDCSKVTGRKIINLDNEKEGSLIVSSAGISDLRIQIPRGSLQTRCEKPRGPLHEIRVDGFLGGHSGMEIHLPRENSIKVLAEILDELRSREGFCLYSVNAGSHMNAIPKAATCCFTADDTDGLSAWLAGLQKKLRGTEPRAELSLCSREGLSFETAYSAVGTKTLVALIRMLRHGVIAMDRTDPSLVETSVNLGRLLETETDIELWCCFRSSLDREMHKGRESLSETAERFGGRLHAAFFETGWPRNLQSTLTPYAVRCYREILREEPRIEGLHAGLECGYWARKIPGADILSLGPTLLHPHTTGERAELASLGRYVKLTEALVRRAESL